MPHRPWVTFAGIPAVRNAWGQVARRWDKMDDMAHATPNHAESLDLSCNRF
ncbi:hypothetical protein MASR2M74_09150 [Paracoccaceae bacterium]